MTTTSPSTRRLLKESHELASHPSPHFTAHPISDTNLYDWHFTLAGPPPPSPYAGGIYHGRIVLPPSYPLRPPSFRFLTPSGRFEVNREICLSISGHHEETWQPAWGIRTALLALRSFMDVDAKGQVGGLDFGEEVRRRYAGESRGWRCEVCGGGTNEEVMRAWREVCRERGVVVDDDQGAVQGAVAPAGESIASGEAEAEPADGKANANTNKEIETVSSQESESLAPRDGAVAPPQQVPGPVPGPVASLSSGPASGPASTSASATTRAEAAAPTPTRTTPLQTTTTTTTATATTSRPTTSEAPWLDRAILGVLIALAFMILRRFAKSEEY